MGRFGAYADKLRWFLEHKIAVKDQLTQEDKDDLLEDINGLVEMLAIASNELITD